MVFLGHFPLTEACFRGFLGEGNNPMVGMTVAVAVSIQEAADNGQW